MATMDRALFFLSCLWLVICPRFVHSEIYNYVLGKQPSIDKAQDAERLLHDLFVNGLKPRQGNNPILGDPKKLIVINAPNEGNDKQNPIAPTIQRNLNNPDNMFRIFIGSNPQGLSKVDIPQYPLLENQMNPSFLKWLQQNLRQQNPESQSKIQDLLAPLPENQIDPSLLKWLQQNLRQQNPENRMDPSLLKWLQQNIKTLNSKSSLDQNRFDSSIFTIPFNPNNRLSPNQAQKIQINPDNTLKIIVDPNSQGPSKIQVPLNLLLRDRMA